MRQLRGRVAIVTGASRGIGVHIASALAAEGVDLALAARSAQELESVRASIEARGVRCIAVVTDVTDQGQLEELVRRCEAELGPVDLLVNNAGIEKAAAYEELSTEDIDRFIDVNLRAPMHLTRLVLPGFVARNRGHVVNISSIAGLAATAYGESYNATKHGVVGFTRALRASEQVSGSDVSASVICPGFVSDVGMYAGFRADGASRAPVLLGTSSPQTVAKAVIRAIKKDLPEVVVNPGPMKLFLAVSLVFPRFGEWVSSLIGAHDVFSSTAKARGTSRKG
ncbi:MAG: SDR family NAD(P)-dependent oxidoreductase [Deltaproteobacteria bacterium]|nr:SDR family NAD(P)-dependent oxidoreductase [Deltaproteobacteria bacterium]